jgi:hypothetical protein
LLTAGLAAVPVIIGGKSRTLDCRRDTDLCVIADWHWGILVNSVEFPASTIVEVSVVKSFSRRPKRGKQYPVYYWMISAGPARSYYSETEYALPSDPQLVEQFWNALKFVDNMSQRLCDGKRFAVSSIWLLAYTFILSISAIFVTFYSTREYIVAIRKRRTSTQT